MRVPDSLTETKGIAIRLPVIRHVVVRDEWQEKKESALEQNALTAEDCATAF